MFGGFKAWLIGGAAVALLIAAAVFYFKYAEAQRQKLLDEIAVLTANNAKLEFVIAEQIKTIDFMKAERIKIRDDFLKAQEAFLNTRRENAKLQEKLLALNLGKITVENLSETETSVNMLQRNLNRCFELETGALWTAEEALAKTAEEFNSECPWIFNER